MSVYGIYLGSWGINGCSYYIWGGGGGYYSFFEKIYLWVLYFINPTKFFNRVIMFSHECY